jgi:type 1 glutamine amidotransferase
MRHLLTFCLLVVLVSPALFSCSSTQPDKVKALYITGGGWHDYETQEELFINGMNERLGDEFEWTIVHEGDKQPDHQVSIMQEENWTEGYDLVVHNTGFGRVNDADFVKSFVEDHYGTPAVLIHSAVQSYRYSEPATPWFEFMGQQSMWHEVQRGFEVENVATDHPIMQDFPETWQNPDDELYVVEEVWGDITPLARAYGVETEEYHTVTWTHEIDDTRIFATTLGHTNQVFETDIFLDTLANGIRWAAGKP